MTDWLQTGSRASGQDWINGLYQQQARQQSGRVLASGGTRREAAAPLLRTGELAAGVGLIEDQERVDAAQEAEQLQFTLQAAKALKDVRAQGGDVLSAYDSYAPVFAQMGTDPAQVQQFRQAIEANPDAFLDGVETIVGQRARDLEIQNLGNGYGVAIDKGTGQVVQEYRAPQADYTLGTARYSGATNQPIAQAPREAEFMQVDPTKALIETRGAQPALGVPDAGRQQPRGIRNNNPGNIEDGPFARSLPGYKGSDGRFAIFETPEAGEQAAPRLLQSYIQRGFDTPAEIINRWAPPSDNNPTAAYAQYVAQRLGIGVGDTVSPEQIPTLAQAIREFENGERGPSQGSGPRVVMGPQASATSVRDLTPQEVAARGLPEGTVAQIKPDGSISVVSRGGAERFTEGQRLSASFYHRALGATQNLDRLAAQGNGRPSPAVLAFGEGRLRENALSPSDRQWVQASRDWLAPILRRDTGAAVSPGELVTYMGTYIPNPTDDAATLAQKAASRRRAQEGLRGTAGGAYEDLLETLGTPPPGGAGSGPRLRFQPTPAQTQLSQQIVRSRPREGRRGERTNPILINPSDATGSYGNVPRGAYYITPDGQLRGPKR